MRSVLLPIIRKLTPSSLAEELCSVQPMTGNVGDIFKFKTVTEEFSDEWRYYQQGSIRHCFLSGWQRFYGTEWISDDLWWKLKIAGY